MNLKEIFADASEIPPDSRAAFLDQACAGDPDLRQKVEDLLKAFDATGGVLAASSVGAFLGACIIPLSTFQEGDILADRFRVERLIGRGGMGEVYQVTDLQLGGKVALKTIRADLLAAPDVASRFHREIRLARQVTHPGVCRMFDVGRHDTGAGTLPFVTMELLAGETLAERLRRGPASHSNVLHWIRQIAEALAALHAAHIVHRDLKPANVMLIESTEPARCVVMDFGIAQSLAAGSSEETLTCAGQLVGTPTYMAPEQLLGKPIGPGADIYALGIVMYEIASGRRPFEAENAVASAIAKLAGPPPPPSEHCKVHPQLEELILACLQRDPAARPKTATSIVATIGQIELKGVVFRSSFRRRRTRIGSRLRIGLVTTASAAAVWAVSGSGAAVKRRLCERFPGTASVCALPADKDIAVLPFQIKGASAADKVLAAGFSNYLRESFARLAPNPGEFCVHFRPDRQTYGMRLVLEGNVEAFPDALEVRFHVREAAQSGGAQPLLLRDVKRRFPLRDAAAPNLDALREMAKMLDLQFSERVWRAWPTPGAPQSFLTHLRGLGYLESGDYQRAADAFLQVIDPTRDFSYAPAHIGLARAYRLLGNATGDPAWRLRARQAVQRAAALDGTLGTSGAEREWGELDTASGDPAGAAVHFSNALRGWPFDSAAQKALASAYELASQPDRAEAALRDAVTRAPRCWLTYNALADFYSRRGRFSDAERLLLEALRLAPDNSAIYHNLAFDYLKSGRLDDAIDMASKSIEIRPHPIAYGTLGTAFLFRGCSSDALVNLRKGVELAPDNPVALASLAEGVRTTGGLQERNDIFLRTVEACTRWLAMNPSDAFVQALLALNLARLERRGEALRQLEKLLHPTPPGNNAVRAAVAALETAGQRRRALALLADGFRNRLSIFEVAYVPDLDALRRDGAYSALLAQFGLSSGQDPGGLVARQPKACPQWSVAGKGLR